MLMSIVNSRQDFGLSCFPLSFFVLMIFVFHSQIRGLAWPAVLIGWVAQSARSLYSPFSSARCIFALPKFQHRSTILTMGSYHENFISLLFWWSILSLFCFCLSLGMKDSWGPLKALAVASAINGVGDVVLCTFLGYGIAGAAWATMLSQVSWNL